MDETVSPYFASLFGDDIDLGGLSRKGLMLKWFEGGG